MSDEGSAPTVLERVRGGVGTLTLNRPRALNAIDIGMVRAVRDALERWRGDSDVQRVALRGAGDRGFCAGGDVRALREAVESGRPGDAEMFLREEYAMNAAIAEYPLPIVAFADGITMGGGIGLACHASVRIVSERSRLAMPETRIGFVPDVGGTWLLARAPGRLGEYLALTGTTIGAADAIDAGLADHLVPADHLASLHDALESRADPAGVSEIVLLFDETPDEPALDAERGWIDDAFSADTVAGIVERLEGMTGDAPAAALATLRELSPMSLTITLAAVRRARTLPGLRDALAMEYGLASWIAHTQPDMPEGIRAQLIDKDRAPRWTPARIEDVDPAIADEALAHTPDTPLWGE